MTRKERVQRALKQSLRLAKKKKPPVLMDSPYCIKRLAQGKSCETCESYEGCKMYVETFYKKAARAVNKKKRR